MGEGECAHMAIPARFFNLFVRDSGRRYVHVHMHVREYGTLGAREASGKDASARRRGEKLSVDKAPRPL